MDKTRFKNILADKNKQQFVISPYDSQESHFRKPLVVSAKVSAPTIIYKRKRPFCLVIPTLDSLKTDVHVITRFLEVHVPYYSVRDWDTNELILKNRT